MLRTLSRRSMFNTVLSLAWNAQRLGPGADATAHICPFSRLIPPRSSPFFNEIRRCYGAVTRGEREQAHRRFGEGAKNDCRNGFDAHNSGNAEIICRQAEQPDVGVNIANAWFATGMAKPKGFAATERDDGS